MGKKKITPRKTHKFQLRQDNPVDLHVQDILGYWKSSREQVTNIRLAIELFYALQQGDCSVLQRMFPLMAGQGGSQSLAIDSMPVDRIVMAIEKLGEKLGQGVVVEQPKKLEQKQLSAPTFDEDEEPALVVKETVGTHTGVLNFLGMIQELGVTKSATPSKPITKRANEKSADEIADNFLNMFA